MASPEQYAQWIVANSDKKGTPEFETVAQAYKLSRSAPQEQPDYSPTSGMSGTDKFLAGTGKAFSDLYQGGKQAFGFGDQAEIDAAKKRDAPLMNTGAGIAGNITGNVAALLPAAFIPGANTYAGAAAIGAGTSLLNPIASDEGSVLGGKLQNAAVGGVVAPAALGLGRALAGVAQGTKALAEPFYKGGQENIVGRTLSRFSDDPAALAAKARGAVAPVPGVQQTLAEATMDPGAATLQRAAQSADPQIATDFANRGMSNNAALVDALRGMSGSDGELAFNEAARKTTAQDLYKKAFAAGIDPKKLTPDVRAAMADLSKNPAIQDAMPMAQRLARFDKIDLKDPSGSLEGLHYVKLALDDMLNKAQTTGTGNVEKAKITATKQDLLGVMERISPKYATAMAEFKAASQPINQMEIAKTLLTKAGSPVPDAAGNPTLFPAAYHRTMNSDAELVKSATGFRQPLANVMTPDQMATMQGIGQQLQAQKVAGDLGRSVGSNTAQNLASQNLMRQLAGPLGLTENAFSNPIAQSVIRPLSFAAKATEPALQKRLAQALLNPKEAADLMSKIKPSQASALIAALQRYVPGIASAGLSSNAAQQQGQQP
jgi:hypothetical protein